MFFHQAIHWSMLCGYHFPDITMGCKDINLYFHRCRKAGCILFATFAMQPVSFRAEARTGNFRKSNRKMHVRLENVGKKFNTDWIFRDVTFSFDENLVTAILGRNGSGKSTLLRLIAGNMHPTAGIVSHHIGGTDVPGDLVFRHLALVAPYMELIEDFTLREMLRFHFSFKRILPGQDMKGVTAALGLDYAMDRQIRQFSSGMKQRVKLVLAIFSDASLLLLDEPTMNLDEAGIGWYHDLVQRFSGNRTIVICSNMHQTESDFAGKILRIEEYR